jgi:hypothetical protein
MQEVNEEITLYEKTDNGMELYEKTETVKIQMKG